MNSEIIRQLNVLQSSYQVLYQKLRSFHWNVTGPQFFGLHAQFETMYLEAAVRIDEIAERTLTAGGKPITTLAAQLGQSIIAEEPAIPGDTAMVNQLRQDLDKLNGLLRTLSKTAAQAGDEGTANLADAIADGQEKTAWMLRAFAS